MDILKTGFFATSGSVLTKLSISDSFWFSPLIILANLLMHYYNTKALQKHHTVKVSVGVFATNLVFTFLFGVFLFGDQASFKYLVGFSLILIGSMIINRD